MKVHLRAAMIVLSASVLSGCAVGGYRAASLQDHLVGAGVPRKIASCVVRRMPARFGDSRLRARSSPGPDELAAERALLKACGYKGATATP